MLWSCLLCCVVLLFVWCCVVWCGVACCGVCVWCVAVAGRVWVCWGWVGLGRGCGGSMGSGRVDGKEKVVASGAGLEEEWCGVVSVLLRVACFSVVH